MIRCHEAVNKVNWCLSEFSFIKFLYFWLQYIVLCTYCKNRLKLFAIILKRLYVLLNCHICNKFPVCNNSHVVDNPTDDSLIVNYNNDCLMQCLLITETHLTPSSSSSFSEIKVINDLVHVRTEGEDESLICLLCNKNY